MPSIADLRRMYPDTTANLKDEDIVNEIARANNWDLNYTAARVGYETPKSDLGKEFYAGGNRYLAGMGHIGAAVGVPGAQEYAAEKEARADLLQGLSKAPHSWDEVKFGDPDKGVMNYVGQAFAGSAPYMAEAVGYAGADALTGGALTPAILARYGAVAPRVLGGGALREGASMAARREALDAGQGFARSAMIPAVTYPSSLGDVLSNQYEQSGGYDLASAVPLAAGYAGMNFGGIEGAIAGRNINNLSRGLTRSRIANAALGGAEFGAKEAGQEVGQEVFNQYARNAVDPTYDPFGDKAMDAYKESAIAAGFLGGLPGSIHGAMYKKAAPIIPGAETDLLGGNGYPNQPGTAGAALTPLGPNPTPGQGQLVFPVDPEANIGLRGLRNPYDTAGFVTGFNNGNIATMGDPQADVFGTQLNPNAGLESLQVAPAVTPATQPVVTPMGQARQAFIDNGGTPRAWATFVSKNNLVDADQTQLGEAILAKANDPKTTNSAPWIATYEAFNPQGNQNGNQENVAGRQEGNGQAGLAQSTIPTREVGIPQGTQERGRVQQGRNGQAQGLLNGTQTPQAVQAEAQGPQAPVAVPAGAPVSATQPQQVAAQAAQANATEVAPVTRRAARSVARDVEALGANTKKVELKRQASRLYNDLMVDGSDALIDEAEAFLAAHAKGSTRQGTKDFRTASPRDKAIIFDRLGWDEEGNAVGEPMTNEAVAEKHGLTAARVNQILVDHGVTDQVVDRAVATDAGVSDETSQELTNTGQVTAINSAGGSQSATGTGKVSKRTVKPPKADLDSMSDDDLQETLIAASNANPKAKLNDHWAYKELTKRFRLREQQDEITDDTETTQELDGDLSDWDARFSKGETQNPTTIEKVKQQLKGLFFTKSRFDNKVTVVNSIDELPADVRQSAAPDGNTQAFVMPNGKAYMIAGNIEQGQELAVFLHEVGVHLGMEGLIGADNFVKLAKQIGTWSQAKGDSIENRIARLAYARVNSAANTAEQEGRPFEDGDIAHELIAYFVEEAVAAGINPTAASKAGGPIYNWFRTMWAAVKTALRKFGLDRVDQLTTQNIVDLAYGAAALELEGTWHGTAADFRRFDHAYMGSGEGAQAFGWGTYLAQRPGIAKEYWKNDIFRKGSQDPMYNGESIFAPPIRSKNGRANYYLNDAFKIARANNTTIKSEMMDMISNQKSEIERIKLQKLENQANPAVDGMPSLLDDGVFDRLIEHEQDRLAEMEEIDLDKIEENWKKPVGSMMRTSVAATEDEMLDRDKPISAQSQYIQDRIYALYPEAKEDPELTGADVYARMEQDEAKENGRKGADKRVSMKMDAAGIKGLMFYDAKSRGRSPEQITRDIQAGEESIADLEKVKQEYLTREDLNVIEGANTQTVGALLARDIDGNIKQLRNNIEKLKNFVQTRNLVVFNDKNIIRAVTYRGADRNKVRFSSKANLSTPEGFFNRLGSTIDELIANPAGTLSQLKLGWMTLEQIADRVKSAAVKQYVGVMTKMQQYSKDLIYQAAKIDQDWGKLNEAVQRNLSQVMRDATRAGFDPEADEAVDNAQEALRQRFNALPDTAQQVYRRVRDHYQKLFDERKAIMLKAAASGALPERNRAEVEAMFKKVKGPYFPLMRIGKWYSVGMSKEMAALQAQVDDGTISPEDEKRYNAMRKDKAHYITSSFESRGQAKAFAKNMKGQYAETYFNAAKEMLDGAIKSVPDLALMQEYVGAGLPEGAKADVKSMLAQMYFDLMPENSPLKRLMKREGIYGEEEDMRKVFATSSISMAHHVSRLKYSTDLSEALQSVRKGTKRDENMTHVYNELVQRANLATQGDESSVIDLMVQGSYFAHLGLSPAFVLTNMTQVPMITAPWLGARYGFGKVTGALSQAYADAAKIVIGTVSKDGWRAEYDWNRLFKEGSNEDKLLKELLDRNLLDITMEHDLGAVGRATSTKTGRKINDAVRWSSMPVRASEAANRLVTGLAAYRLEMSKSGNHERAVEMAAKAISETQLNYSALNAPRYMQSVMGSKAIAKLMFQFRKYQQGMVYLITKSAYDAVKGGTKQEKAEAAKTLFGLLTTTGLMAGATGLPFAGSAFWLATVIGGMFGDDDEPFDAEVSFRNYLADMLGDDAARAVAKGLPTLMGTDISGNVGQGNIGMPFPFMRDGKKPSEGLANMLVAAAGAPFETLQTTVDGIGEILDGDFAKGTEHVLPLKAAKNLVKAYRYSSDGMTDSKGNIILPPENFSPWDLAIRSAGFTNVKESDYYAANNAMQKAKQAATDVRASLLREYANARLAGEDVSDFQERIADFNSRHPEKGVRIDQSSLLKAVTARRNLAKDRTETGLRRDKYMKPYLDEARFADGE